jgi:hypothetical protein
MSAEFLQLAREARAKAALQVSTAAELHLSAWRRVLDMAAAGGLPKYGIYASRTLAVPQPDVYLRADALFWGLASTVRGFRDAYPIRYAADMYMMQWFRALDAGLPLGEPLTWDDIPAAEYSVVRARAAYPAGYPFLGFLDQRMAPLAVTLKTDGNLISGLERAEHEYFRALAHAADPARLFLVLCADESAYLAKEDTLVAMASLAEVTRVTSAPVLIFNQESVWYPLMGRDDRASAPGLAAVVARLGAEQRLPDMSAAEAALAAELKLVAALDTPQQVDMAMLASLRGHGNVGDLYNQVWVRSVVPHDLDNHNVLSRRLGIIRECNRHASTLSPVSAYIAALVCTAPTQQIGLSLLSGEYLKHVGVVREDERGFKKPGRLEAWGHLWYCPLMEYTIDDSWRSGGGHCVSQSMNLSAALDLAGVDHYVTHFNRGGVQSMDHHFVSSSDGEWVLDDAMLNFFATGAPKNGDWGCLLSFSKQGRWASLLADEYFGNIPPAEAMAEVERIEALVGGRFAFNFLKLEGDQLLPKEEWLAHMNAITDWQPTVVP